MSTPIIAIDPSTVIGPMFFGNMINWMLMGVLAMQTYNYWRKFPDDRVVIKAFVFTVFSLDAAQTALGTHLAWWWSVKTWGNPASFQTAPWSSTTIVFFCVFISGPVQMFYAYRIWALRKSIFTRVLTILIVVLATMQCVAGLTASCLVLKNLTQENLLRLHPVFVCWLAGSLTTDILIAGTMTWLLYISKPETNINGTIDVINRLIINTVQTGAITVVAATIQMALFIRFIDANYYFSAGYILGKLYSNSFIATLNARKSRMPQVANFSSGQSDSIPMRIQVSKRVERREADKKSSAVDTLDWATASSFPV
ncbi:hypothetical protein DFH06DRAFT_1199773 [Mycena polygramma]|nr:hypothetical protein DFH06DRAFT_1199773 [Mycena polygramma]